MGSSPVTATISSHPMDLLPTLESFFRDLPAGPVVVAFSGGPDSTALLWEMARLPERDVIAAHLDHAIDAGSAARAGAAAGIARSLGVPFVTRRIDVPALRRPGEGLEAAARRVRYGFLERTRMEAGARWIATAHHRDDQAETVLLRLLFGSGLEGLAGVRPVHGAVVRPLLEVPRAALLAAVRAAGLAPVEDPTNLDLDVPRNRVRHRLLPALAREEPDLTERLARLAGKARAAGRNLDLLLGRRLPARETADGIAVERRDVEALPEELRPFAFSWLHRRAGAPYPAGEAARSELARQLAGPGRAACDCGGGWRWEERSGSLVLRRPAEERERVPDFTYTLEVPGELEIPEIAVRVRVTRRAVEPWMFQGAADRAGLALPLTEGDRVTIRNRRPGDRIHPLGAGGSRRLKEVLIDRRVPRRVRERLPLLCVGGRIAWAPGVTIDERFRITGQATAWVAEVATT
ncbi:MAG: tRNA lysidine(34) synthetase TilS [Thermoanaerobaculia bacterium]